MLKICMQQIANYAQRGNSLLMQETTQATTMDLAIVSIAKSGHSVWLVRDSAVSVLSEHSKSLVLVVSLARADGWQESLEEQNVKLVQQGHIKTCRDNHFVFFVCQECMRDQLVKAIANIVPEDGCSRHQRVKIAPK